MNARSPGEDAGRPERAVAVLRADAALAILRLTLGAMFIYVFFENLAKGLYTAEGYARLIATYIEKGRAPGVWKGVMAFMAGHAATVAPVQAITEITFGACLVLGALTRPIALAAFVFLTSLWVSEWGTAWLWELLIPMAVALCLSLAAAGRTWGIDGVLARRCRGQPFW